MMSQVLHPNLSPNTQVLDARPIFEGGTDPFNAIMQALAGLKPGQGLAVRAPFEPKPLFAVMASKGFNGRSLRLADDDWLAEFLPIPALQLDVRGLQPPEPLVQIFSACENLAPGQTLEVTHDRRPQMLYPRLDEQSLAHRTEERADGEIRVFVTRPSDRPKP